MIAGQRVSFRTRNPCPTCLFRGMVVAVRVLRWIMRLPGGGGVIEAPGSPNIRYCPVCDGALDQYEVTS